MHSDILVLTVECQKERILFKSLITYIILTIRRVVIGKTGHVYMWAKHLHDYKSVSKTELYHLRNIKKIE